MVKKSQAKEFKRDVIGTLKRRKGIVTEYTISCKMLISLEQAREFLHACVKYGLMKKASYGYEL